MITNRLIPKMDMGIIPTQLTSTTNPLVLGQQLQHISQQVQDIGTTIGTLTQTISGALGPLEALLGNTPLMYTTGNPVVSQAWMTMVGITDAFLGLYVIIKIIQMMYGDAIGVTHIPQGQFVAKVILTVILIHASAFLGTQLITIVNALSGPFRMNTQQLILQVNNGQMFDPKQNFTLSLVLSLVFGFGLLRVIFQSVKRVVFFNVLFVFSGPAFLMSLDQQTAPWFQFWFRTYLVTILEQFIQALTFFMGFQFLISLKTTGFTGFILAIALLNLTAEIPSLMSRFATSAGTSAPGLGSFARGAMTAAQLLILR